MCNGPLGTPRIASPTLTPHGIGNCTICSIRASSADWCSAAVASVSSPVAPVQRHNQFRHKAGDSRDHTIPPIAQSWEQQTVVAYK